MISIPWYWYLAAIPVFGILVLVHEFGHFIMAKWAGIRVDEFAIGFPPRLFSFKRGETTYAINLLPIGGYVKMPGENGEMTNERGEPDPRAFASRPASKRLIVLLAGVTMNLIFALVFFTAAEAVGNVEFRPVIATVQSGSPAQAAGLRTGDTFVSIDGQSVKYFTDVQRYVGKDVQKALQANQHATTTPVAVVVRHSDGSTLDVTINARVNSAQGALGVSADETNPHHVAPPIWKAPGMGVQDMGNVLVATYHGIGQVVAGVLPFNQAVSGPVGIVSITGQTAAAIPIAGPYLLLFLIGALNMSLAIMNLLPIPALDGGRVMFVLIEVLRRGKRISPEREGLVNLIGMAAVLLLVAVITFSDITNLLGGH